MKRLASLFLALTFVIGISSFAEASGHLSMVPSFLREYIVYEEESNTQFSEVTQVAQDFWDQLGYYPKFDIDYESQMVEFYLLNTMVKVPAIVDRNTKRVLLPDFLLPDEYVEVNDLTNLLPDVEEENSTFNVRILQISGAEIRSIKAGRDLKIMVYLEQDGKPFEVSTLSYIESNGEYYVYPSDFRQLYYSIYRR